jgi:hypothetical protein
MREAIPPLPNAPSWCGAQLKKQSTGPERRNWWEAEKLHNEELHNLYASPDVISLIKSRRMNLAGHVARMGEMNA